MSKLKELENLLTEGINIFESMLSEGENTGKKVKMFIIGPDGVIRLKDEKDPELETKTDDQITCPKCGGDGYTVCTKCEGNGYIIKKMPIGVKNSITFCPECKGVGDLMCPDCNGSGKINSSENIDKQTIIDAVDKVFSNPILTVIGEVKIRIKDVNFMSDIIEVIPDVTPMTIILTKELAGSLTLLQNENNLKTPIVIPHKYIKW